MNLCSDGHDEVCFEARRCPACEVGKEKDAVITKLENENGDLLDTIHEQKTEIEDLKGQIPE